MSDFSLTLVLHFKTSKNFNGIAMVQIKFEKITPFGGIFSIMEQFDSMLSPIIDQTLGQRCSSIFGYQFSEIANLLFYTPRTIYNYRSAMKAKAINRETFEDDVRRLCT